MMLIRDSENKHILNIINELKIIETKLDQFNNFKFVDYLSGYNFYKTFFNNYNEFFTDNINENYKKYFNNCNIIYNYMLLKFNNLDKQYLELLEDETYNLLNLIRNDYLYNLLEKKSIIQKKLIHYEYIKQKKKKYLLNISVIAIITTTALLTTIIINNYKTYCFNQYL